MSHFIPFDIQSEIINRLPVKSLMQFRSVSKLCKSLDSPKFIKNYHINHPNPQHHLFVSYQSPVQTYTSIIDNHTFPKQKLPLTAPELLSLLTNLQTLSAVNGLLYFYGKVMAVIWNPTLRKSVGIGIPFPSTAVTPFVDFGVCPDTSDPKLFKINVDKISRMWEVEVYTLSTCAWKTVYTGAPLNRSEKFADVCLPETLVKPCFLDVANVNDSLALLESYYDTNLRSFCGVWTRKPGANEPFTKIYTVKLEGKSCFMRVLGFRNNAEAVTEVLDHEVSGIKVYDPLSGLTNAVGINGEMSTCSARSYMETLLLLDELDSMISYPRTAS
ncbi:putative pentatricopeptide repeat-containing protein [Tanacetum coccineum]